MFKMKPYDKNIIQETLRMAWPAVLESFFVALAGLIDSYMVSGLGSSAVASIGLTTQPKFLCLSLFFATNISVSALVARRKGEGLQSEANQIASTAIFFVTVMSIISSILLVVFAGPIMKLCGSNAETHDGAVIYYQILMGGMIFNTLQMVINAAQRGSGYTRITMVTNVTSALVNIIANYTLIEGHFGFPAMGIRGAAIATVFGTVVACVMSFISITHKYTFINLPLILHEKLWPTFTAFRHIFRIGYSVFFEQILMRVGFMLTAIMAADQGTYAMAAHQVAMNIMGLSFSFGDGLQATAVALIGYSLGKEDPDMAKEYGRTCRMIGFVIAAVLSVVYWVGARPLFSAFFTEPEIINIGVDIMHIIIVVVLLQITQVIYMGCLRGAGDTLYTAMASTVSVTIVRTLGSYIGGYMLGLGIAGIWLGVLADQLSRYLFGSIRFKQGKWVKIKI